MNRKHVIWLVLGSLPLLYGCAHHGAAAPVGRSTTTGAVLCPEGYVTSTDGTSCVLPKPPSSYEENIVTPP
jgi:hypothetical protein